MPDNLFITVSKDEDRDQVLESIVDVEAYFAIITNTLTDLFTHAIDHPRENLI